MNIIAIVQARMGSTRLPGKVMREVKGKPLIGYLLERVACASELNGVVVAMPRNDVASPLARYVASLGVAYYCGQEENDVAARFKAVLDETKPDAFARLCGDSPLIDPAVIDGVVAMFRTAHGEDPADFDFATSVGPGSHGQGVEVVSVDTYRRAYPEFTPAQREHAGFPYFYERNPRLCVDTEEDFQRIARVIGQMDRDHTQYDWRDCARLARLQ